jgi:hypothetical protein
MIQLEDMQFEDLRCVQHGLAWSCDMYVCMCGNGVPRTRTTEEEEEEEERRRCPAARRPQQALQSTQRGPALRSY